MVDGPGIRNGCVSGKCWRGSSEVRGSTVAAYLYDVVVECFVAV